MNRPKSSSGKNGMPAVKALATAAAVLGTVGGWGVLSHQSATEAHAESISSPDPNLDGLLAELQAPLPTLVPPPSGIVIEVQPTPTLLATQAVPLRVVNRPPAPKPAKPVTKTRSSRK
jgi:hypothetical protein